MLSLGPLITVFFLLYYVFFKWLPRFFLFAADKIYELYTGEKPKYKYVRKHEYQIRIPIVTATHFCMVKELNLDSWGKQNDKLRDLVIQCSFFSKVAARNGKKGMLITKDSIPQELSWLREEILKTGIELKENF